ncbi:putative photosynthetic complex assembly protein PuhE [Aurantiacibacter spongiae]|uniref:DUF3623 family protein n=1 Tax=Aurantiacibacter spongiae TaxID=2488860 RepID=A0A3N5DJ92_9SPHN|nr:putative photosynthetic complex assembly protein PuhE [Aurantiacibacter spongiae]RPF71762.1 DUF3623 family protein [Aurantiacibacter spongiae]
MTIAIALVAALVLWWASTVLIIYLDGLRPWTFKYSFAGATLVMAASLWGLHETASDTSLTGAYLAFVAGLLAWGWQEVSFYMGIVTGPRKAACPEGCGGWKHFGHAIQTSLWHELAIIASAVAVVALTWGQPNQFGTWTFMILWWMHQSAKLNVFLGVRNLNEEFLPEHLTFLKGFLNKRAMNLLFPFSITISTVITVVVAQAAFADGASAFEQAGYSFLTAMMALAILEHWMLVLPMPTAALWSAGLKSRGEIRPFVAEIVVGFLGAGKTTFLQRLLAEADPAEKTVVLVNDFGELGIDAGLVSGGDAEVVELPNGCICCSLRGDVTDRLRTVLADMQPDRVLIEPSGVADVGALLGVLETPEIKPHLRETRLWTVIDAAAFVADYARLHDYFAVQARLAPVFIVNKTDLVDGEELATVLDTLASLNPRAETVLARHAQPIGHERTVVPVLGDRPEPHVHGSDSDDRAGHHHHGPDALGFESASLALDGSLSSAQLRSLLARLVDGEFGRIARAKGIARDGDGWLKFDIAGGRASVTAHIPRDEDTARVMLIGSDLDREGLATAFAEPAAGLRLVATA